MQLAEEIVCFIRGLSWAGLPKSRARDRTWEQGIYLEGDARKQEAGTGESERNREKPKRGSLLRSQQRAMGQ